MFDLTPSLRHDPCAAFRTTRIVTVPSTTVNVLNCFRMVRGSLAKTSVFMKSYDSNRSYPQIIARTKTIYKSGLDPLASLCCVGCGGGGAGGRTNKWDKTIGSDRPPRRARPSCT
ncbi:hypothetical protein J6590_039964 [Homalodisca vitripennis]|nr:hypothetical protein J6590_039964 [Homalodisca vitripennis]